MARELITRDQLANWLTQELQKVEDCSECLITGINLLRTPDEQGCNWSDSIVVQSGGVPAAHFGPALKGIVARARAQFNIGG